MYRHLLQGHGIHKPFLILTRHRITVRLTLPTYGILTNRYISMDIEQTTQGMKRTVDDLPEQDGSKKMKLDEPSEGDAAPVGENDASGAEEQLTASQPEAGPSKPSTSNQPKSRKQKKFEKRADRKERRRATLRPDGEERAESSEPKGPRLPKRQCALLVGYSGAGYNGMQMYVTRLYLEVERSNILQPDLQAI